MAVLSPDDVEVLTASSQNINIFTQFYFGITLLPHQVAAAHAAQNSILTLGGRGSGKSFGYAFVYLWLATLQPDFRVLWTSYTGDQAGIAFFDVLKPAIKVRAIQFAQDYGAEMITTGNEINNPMYQINLALGFKPQPSGLTMKKFIERTGDDLTVESTEKVQ